MTCQPCGEELDPHLRGIQIICRINGHWRFACEHQPPLSEPEVSLASTDCTLRYAQEHPEHFHELLRLLQILTTNKTCH